jgi:hypothetical protein
MGVGAQPDDGARMAQKPLHLGGAATGYVVAVSGCPPWSDRGSPDLVQPITKVRVRHHQVDQPAVLGTRRTRHTQRAGVSGADGALGLRWCPHLDHLDPPVLRFSWRLDCGRMPRFIRRVSVLNAHKTTGPGDSRTPVREPCPLDRAKSPRSARSLKCSAAPEHALGRRPLVIGVDMARGDGPGATVLYAPEDGTTAT